MPEWFPYRLMQHADQMPNQPLFAWLERDLSIGDRYDYASFTAQVAVHAGYLAQHTKPGERVLLLLPPSLDFAICFMACLHAGRIAVPLYPPNNAARTEQVKRVIGDCQPTAAWINKSLVDSDLGALKLLQPLKIKTCEAIAPRPCPIAFLQYTSGSVGTPKGVIITQDNLSAHAQTLKAAFDIRSEDVGLSWLPPYHDMGLIGCVLQPIWLGQATYLMSPMNFVRKPQLWLQALSKYAATVSGAPNFAYRWCANLAEEARAGLDLSKWRVAFCGAEPIQPQTLATFAATFAAQGFQRRNFLPCYGLAETTLLVTGNPPNSWQGEAHSGEAQGVDIKIVVQDQRTKGAGQTGEICVKGVTLSPGYWNDPVKTAERFRPADDGQRWLHTGDLGCFEGGKLKIRGRLQDLLIIQGRNLYPEDVERIAYQHPDLQAAAAIGQSGHQGTQDLILLLEFTRNFKPDLETLRQLRKRISAALDVTPHLIQVVRPGQLPRTTSGKIQRHAAKRQFAASGFTIRMALNEAEIAEQPKQDSQTLTAEALWCRILAVERLAADADWFASGGDSRRTAHLLAELERISGQSLDFDHLWHKRRFSDFAAWFEQLQTSKPQPKLQPIDSASLELSAVQQRLWLQMQQRPGSSNQQLVFALQFENPIKLDTLHQAWQDLLQTYPHFSYRLNDLNGLLWQQSTNTEIELSEQDTQTKRQQLIAQPLDPRKRGIRVSYHTKQRCLLIAIHHLYTDGWALQAALHNLQSFYTQRDDGLHPEIEPRPFAPQGKRAAKRTHSAFWQKQLNQIHHNGSLPFDFAASDNYAAATYTRLLEPKLGQQLAHWQSQSGLTPFAILSCCLQITLQRYCGAPSAILSAFANRHHAATANIAGPAFELAPLYLDISIATNFKTHVEHNHTQLRQINQNLVDFAQMQTGDNHDTLKAIQVLLLHQYQPDKLDFAGKGAKITQIFAAEVWLPLEIVLVETPTTWTIHWRYQSARFDQATIAAIAQSFEATLQQGLTHPQMPITRTALPPKLQAKPPAEAPLLEDILDLDKHANAAALNFITADQQQSLSYAQLQQRVSDLAAALKNQKVGPGDRIAIHCQRTPALAIAILASLRVGASFIPIPLDTPKQRADWILQDCRASVLLTNLANPEIPSSNGSPQIRTISTDSTAKPQPITSQDPQQIAYIIYTSGSSGRPKGVTISRAALAHFLSAFAQCYPLKPQERLLALTTESFDISLLELLYPLTQGATVTLTDEHTRRDGKRIAELIEKHQITHLQATPATWRLWLQTQPQPAPELTAYCGGERLDASLATQLQTKVKRLINLYGPTEATIWAGHHPIAASTAFDTAAGMPLGEWLPGTTGWIADAKGNPTPNHGVGELYLSGPILAQGYWQRPDLTAASFLPHPHSSQPGARCYRTGDLVRIAADGKLRFLRRIDRQIKLHGFRIELGEIEAQLMRHPQVQAAAVLQRPQIQQLEAHYESDQPIADLREHLGQTLLSYMIPSRYQHHSQLPLNTSGKVDRRQLAPIQTTPAEPKTNDPLTQAVIQHYRQVLASEAITAETNFFAASGHSLKALELRFALQTSHGVSPPMQVLFEQATPALLANWLRHQTAESPTATPSTPITQAPLLPSMQPIWMWQQLHPNSSAYHLAAAIDLPEHISEDQLRSRIDQLIQRHHALRIAIHMQQLKPFMKLQPTCPNPLESQTLTDQQSFADVQKQLCKRPFKLEAGEVFRAAILQQGKQRRLLLVIHHLVCDGWSLAILLRDLAQPETANPTSLLEIAAQHQATPGRRLARRWWQNQCGDVDFKRSLPASSKQATSHSAVHYSRLSDAQHQQITRFSQNHQLTPFAVYLNLYQHHLAKTIAATDFALAVPIAQRLASTADTVGMFAQQILLPWLPNQSNDLAQTSANLQRWLAMAIDRADACSYAALAGQQASLRGPQLGFWYQQAVLQWPGLADNAIQVLEPSEAIADLILEMRPDNHGGMQMRWLYDAGVHSQTQIETLAQEFERRINQAIESATLPQVVPSQISTAATQASSPPEPPQGQREQQIARLWQQILHTAIDDRHADFFYSGGHSLLAMQLVGGLNMLVQHGEVTLQDVFSQRSVAQQARMLQQKEKADHASDNLAKMLDQLEQLSDEEARRLLDNFE